MAKEESMMTIDGKSGIAEVKKNRNASFFTGDGAVQFSTFLLENQLFGVEVLRVQEVLRYQANSGIPLAPSYVAGLINLRGQIVTLLNLRKRLGLPEMKAGKMPMNVVVNSHEGPVSLMVDEIGDVLEVPRNLFEPPPPTMSGVMSEYVQCVCKLEGKLLVVLDVEQVLEA